MRSRRGGHIEANNTRTLTLNIYRVYKNIYGQKYWEYMGRQITEILEKPRKLRKKKLENLEKLKKPTKNRKTCEKLLKYIKMWAVRLFIY